MNCLVQSLPVSTAIGAGDFDQSRMFMAELWLRDITKDQFLSEIGWN